jgi:thiol-disulfide isomerase/thioredoxin
MFSSCKKHAENKLENVIENQNENSINFIGNSSKVFDVKARPGGIPDFSWYNEKNQKINFADYRGKIIIINFWATWCTPCRNEIPTLLKIYNQNNNKGLILLGISLDQEINLTDLASFTGDNEINYQIILDDGMLESAFGGITAIPTTFIISKDFKIVTKFVGEINERALNQALEGLL